MSETQTGKGRGCFFYGCLSVVILALACAVGLYFGVRYAINRAVEQYTSATPVAIEVVQASPAEIAAVQDRFKTFTDAIRAGQPAESLSLSAKDLNLLINHAPDLPQFKDHVQVTIEGAKLKAKLSLPLDSFGIAKLKGRYFNGAAEVNASLENGVLFVTLDALEVNGKPVPEQIMAAIRSQNLAKDVYKDARSVEVLKKLDSIQVEDGRVLVKPREKAP